MIKKIIYSSLLILLITCGKSFSLSRKNLLFYLPFQKTFQPLISQGKTEIQFANGKQSENFEFVKGVRGFGLKIISHPPYQTPINYLNKNMFSPREGTISFWIKPVGWKGGDDVNHFFVTVYGEKSYFMIYKFFPGNTWVYLAGPGGKTTVVGNGNGIWKNGNKWVFLAFTFNPEEQCFYINGKLSGKSTAGLIELDFSKSCQLSIDEGSQVIDEIMTFNRALTEKEVEAIYRANKPLNKNDKYR